MPKLSDRYYTGRDVQRLLGITEPALRNLVNQRKIKKVIPPGKQYGVYLKAEVDDYAEKWMAFLTAKEPPKTTFEIAQPSDMDMVYDVALRAIGPTMSAELRRSWLEKNPESCYVVKHNEKVVAFFHLLPLQEECLMDFMAGKIRGWNITADKVETYEEGKAVSCLLIIASEPDLNDTTRMHYVSVLLRGIRRELGKLGQRGIIFSKFYATSETPTGIAMSIHAGMQEYGKRLNKRLTFVLDPETSTSFLLIDYKKELKEWQKTHNQNRKNRISPAK
ncbi:helix-turn-helix domain-containing protein [Dictyobacter formicarum]|uniref:Helix-turn-helix domain-containing protein n=1 Tax=Dictyobacter formicarum TaxID=2778368 RepID=A0ABQ3VLS3_9CHLR|nr:helix-turn-helix domain-containing protein [Dictyobacter formicarum]GHO86631.1 hypothetical protein KSZ_46370 [Dictyobacter formicarum]